MVRAGMMPRSNKPRAFNHYAYTFNNPLRYIDPTGHVAVSQIAFSDSGSGGSTSSTSSVAVDQANSTSTSSTTTNYHPISGPMFPDVVPYIYGEMMRNISSPIANSIRYWNNVSASFNSAAMATDNPGAKALFGLVAAGAKVVALYTWGINVGPGQTWDHKTRINNMFGAEQKVFGVTYSSDTWSNIHYGYVGRDVGFSAAELAWGAGIAQLGHEIYKVFRNDPVRDTNYFGNLFAGRLARFEDPADQAAIRLGVELWDIQGRRGLRISQGQFARGVDRREQLNRPYGRNGRR
jgi:hypothetical protein